MMTYQHMRITGQQRMGCGQHVNIFGHHGMVSGQHIKMTGQHGKGSSIKGQKIPISTPIDRRPHKKICLFFAVQDEPATQ